MKILTATICLTIAVLLGSVERSLAQVIPSLTGLDREISSMGRKVVTIQLNEVEIETSTQSLSSLDRETESSSSAGWIVASLCFLFLILTIKGAIKTFQRHPVVAILCIIFLGPIYAIWVFCELFTGPIKKNNSPENVSVRDTKGVE